MLDIEVVNVRDYGTTSKLLGIDGMYFFCGRGSRWGNPHKMKTEADRPLVINKFKNNPKVKPYVKQLIKYLGSHENITKVKLGCYCAPKACHCDVIKEWIEKGVCDE